MATSSPVVQSNVTPGPGKLPVVPLMIAVVVGVVIATVGVGGIVYYLARSGRLPVSSGRTVRAEAAIADPTHAMVLEPLLVNLADGSGGAYLRVGITLRVADAVDRSVDKAKEEKNGDSKASKETEAALRDTALTVLGRQTSEELLGAEGKERLKAQLKAAMAEHNADVKVADLFFTEFLVQR